VKDGIQRVCLVSGDGLRIVAYGTIAAQTDFPKVIIWVSRTFRFNGEHLDCLEYQECKFTALLSVEPVKT